MSVEYFFRAITNLSVSQKEYNNGKILSCCNDLTLVSLASIDNPFSLVDWSDLNLWLALWLLGLHAIFWSIAANAEKKTKILSSLFCNNKWCSFTCYCILNVIMTFTKLRLTQVAVHSQASSTFLQSNFVLVIGNILHLFGLIGLVYVIFTLGWLNLFFSDCFDIPCKKSRIYLHRYCNYPLYMFSMMCYFGYSLVFASQTGILISIVAMIMYIIASHYEPYQ